MTSVTPRNTGGGVTTWSISPALPASLIFDTSNGTISGTANAVMVSTNYTIVGTNNGGTDNAVITITVIPSPIDPPDISYPISTATYYPRLPITTLNPTNIGGVIRTWDVSPELPAGLSFDTSTGVVSGIPTELVATTDYVFLASNSGGSSGFTITFSVQELPNSPSVNWITSSLGTLTQSAPVTIQLVALTASVFSIISGALPAGLTLNASTGVISGSPTGTGPYTVQIFANNIFGNGRTIIFSGTVLSGAAAPGAAAPGAAAPGTVQPTPQPSADTSTGTSSNLPTPLPAITPPTPLAPGSSYATVDGAGVVATLVPNNTSTGMILSAPGWNLNLAAKTADGGATPLNDQNQIVVEQGKFVSVSGDGFLPFSTVTTYIFSSPVLLGTVQTDANGAFSERYAVPTSLESGVHNLQVNGLSPSKEVRSATVGLLLTRPTSSAAGLITFDFNVYKISSKGLKVIKALNLSTVKSIAVYGYAQNNRTNDDVRISLDRALEVKKQIKKMYPKLQIDVLGMGAKPVAACAPVKNRCAVVVVKK
jgi:outer membrane protein OmpA-like peptidoglycan-associated protein